MEKIGLIAVFDVSQFNRGLRDYLGGVKDANRETKDAEKSGFSFARALETAVGFALVEVGKLALDLATKLGGIFVGTVEDAISLESAFAGVIKTTDGLAMETGHLTEAGEELKQGYRDLAKEIPVTIEELMGIGEVGGQLGIQKENLLDFTETIAALGVSTNLSAESAAVGLAQFSNVVGTSQADIDNLGSTIVHLGNNFATTERDVLNFGSRIAGAGAIAGLSEGDILGIGAAFSSIGISAEAGGTAVQKVLLDINNSVTTGHHKVEDYAEAAGMSSQEFAEAWEEDAAGAFTSFVVGLGEAGDDAAGILDTLELKDQRLGRAFLSLAQNSELLEDAISDANMAFDENTALSAEAEARYRTTESQIQILKNNFRDMGFTIGESVLPAINSFIEAIIPILDEYGPLLEQTFTVVSESILGLVDGFIALFGTNPQGGIAEIGEVIGNVFGEDAQQIFIIFAEIIKDNLPQAIEVLKTAFSDGVAFIGSVIEQFKQFFVTISPIINSSMQEAAFLFESFAANADEIWNGIKETISGVLDIILGLITTFLGLANGEWEIAWEGMTQVTEGTWQAIGGIFEAGLGVIASIMGLTVEEVKLNLATVLKVASNSATKLVAILLGVLVSASETATQLVAIVSLLITNAVSAIASGVSHFFNAGLNLIQGLIDGIKSAAGAVAEAVGGVVDGAIEYAKQKLGIQSPSKVFAEFGVNINKGMAEGINESGMFPQRALSGTINNLISSPSTTNNNSSINNVDNSKSISLEIINNGASDTGNSVFFDVVAGLEAVGA